MVGSINRSYFVVSLYHIINDIILLSVQNGHVNRNAELPTGFAFEVKQPMHTCRN